MKRVISVSVLLVAGLALGGCSTVAVDRAKDLSSAGIHYAQATAAVVDVAIDATVDADSEAQIRSKPRQPVTDTSVQSGRGVQLDKLNAALVQTVSSYTRLKRSVSAIEAYFKALQDLANGSTADATGDAVENLAVRIKNVSAAIDKDSATSKLSEAEVTAIAGLAKLVAAQVHGAKVAKALERDASVIGKALVLQEKLLILAGDDIRNNLAEANNRFFVDKVQVPYKKGEIDTSWADDRRTYLKVKALGQTHEAVNSAAVSAKQMQTVWTRILSGEYSAKEMTALLKDTAELLDAVQALKDARKSK